MKLTQNEIFYLCDVISIHAEPPPGLHVSGSRPPYPEMILKLMEAIVSHASGTLHEVEVDFTLDELMMVYEHSRVSVVVGTEKVGYNLIVKASTETLERSVEITVLDESVYGEFSDGGNTEPNTSNAENRATD